MTASYRFDLNTPSPNFDTRGGVAVDCVVLHYTGMQDRAAALRRLVDPAPRARDYPGPWSAPEIDPAAPLPRVSAHFVVAEDGLVHQLVDEGERAWHAGVAFWAGAENINARSIGIEIVNGGHDFGLPAYPARQIAALIALLHDVCGRHAIAPWRILAHSDVAPGRKADPGEHFPWPWLAKEGLGLWPADEDRIFPPNADDFVWREGDCDPAIAVLNANLADWGYKAGAGPVYDGVTRAAVEAFQRRYRPAMINGEADSATARRLAELLRRRAGAMG